jgi:hypothetical protein
MSTMVHAPTMTIRGNRPVFRRSGEGLFRDSRAADN